MDDANASPRWPAFRGTRPTVDSAAFVSGKAYLVGDVSVGERASIWPFACARGDGGPVSIGAECNVQELTMLHGASLGDRVSVGHGAVVDFATVESDTLIGLRSAILRGATVESDCLVAAGAVVPPGRTIPSGHLAYGVPAETTRLRDEHRAEIARTHDHYVELSQEYKAAGGFD